MVNYRRNRIHGGTYFFTVTLANRRSTMLTDHINLLRDAFRTVRRERPFEIVAMVVLPEPGGPQNITENSFPVSRDLLSALDGPRR